MNEKPIDKNFDGHLEKPLCDMTPKGILDHIWSQMQLKKYINEELSRKTNGK
jgi:hypothetical protein